MGCCMLAPFKSFEVYLDNRQFVCNIISLDKSKRYSLDYNKNFFIEEYNEILKISNKYFQKDYYHFRKEDRWVLYEYTGNIYKKHHLNNKENKYLDSLPEILNMY